MARTEEAEAFFSAVYSAVQEIPHGKVTSYGHIARLIGTRKSNSTTSRTRQGVPFHPYLYESDLRTIETGFDVWF
jgi:methylated-DNA-protein-cysteine methyltransferase related protein